MSTNFLLNLASKLTDEAGLKRRADDLERMLQFRFRRKLALDEKVTQHYASYNEDEIAISFNEMVSSKQKSSMKSRRKSPVEPENIQPHMCSTDVRYNILRHVPFFAMLPEAAIARINENFREQGFEVGEPIYYAGDPATRLYVVAAGKIKQMRHTLSGQDVLLDILSEGDFFGSLAILGDETYPDTTIAQTGVCTLSIDAEGFRQILQSYPPVTLEVLNITGQRLRDAQEAIHQLSAYSVDQRLAYTLLKLADKLGEPQEVGILIQMPLSREDLAGMTGATPETISRTMSQFQKAGWIDSGRQWVAIRDSEALKEVADA